MGSNEELYRPGGELIPPGTQEIVVGVKSIQYNATPGGGREPQWESLEDIDVGAVVENEKKLDIANKQLERENAKLKKRLSTLGYGEEAA